jgi:excisionase family DNA binding protein
MGKLINFDNFNPANLKRRGTDSPPSNFSARNEEPEADQSYQLTLDVLVKNNPDKIIFSIKEVADILGVGEEFIRRRTKTGKIRATYLGDKPFINVVELARISTEGV